MSARDRRHVGKGVAVKRQRPASAGVRPPPAPVNQPDGTGDPTQPPQGEQLDRPDRRRKERST